MRTEPLDGCWYADCHPNGAWCAVRYGSHVESSWGEINFLLGPTPAFYEPLFIRLNNDGTAFAGQAHGVPQPHPLNDRPVEYLTGSGLWAALPFKSVGTNPVIYDKNNQLVVADGSTGTGSQGYRYLSIGGFYPAGRLVTGDETIAPTAAVPGLWEWTDLTLNSDFPNRLYVGQGADENTVQGGVLVWDGYTHRVLAPGRCRNIRAHRDGDNCAIAFYEELGGQNYRATLVWATVAELRALPPLQVPEPEKPIGPDSDSLPEGTEIDLAPYFTVNRQFWPRGVKPADTHGLNAWRIPELERDGDYCTWFQKFAEQGPQSARNGELLSIDAKPDGLIRLRADASNRTPLDTWTDDRWLLKRMKVGRQYGLDTGDCQLVKKDRDNACAVTERRDFSKENWIVKAWPSFYWGKDLGSLPTVLYAYNNTGVRTGQTTDNPGLNLELYWVGLNVGWLGWDTFPAKDVFKTGQFVLPSDVPKTKFCRIGGGDYRPDVPVSCIPPATVENPVSEPIPSYVYATLQQYAAAFPMPQGGDDVVMHVWSRRAAELVKYRHGTDTEDWGLKSTSVGSPISHNITRRVGNLIDTWDYIEGSAGLSPKLKPAEACEHFHIPMQVFYKVTAVNHLAQVLPTPGRAKLAGRIWGVDAFDLAPRVALGDRRWLDQVLVPTQLASRQFMYATPMAPPRLQRDAATGLQQMAALLPKMRAAGARGSLVTVLCGTRNNGTSWQDALSYCRAVNALALQFPELIVGFDLFNENLQGFEQDYAVNAQFLKEAEACFDLRFSVSPGATWGDQPPFIVCGSHAVAHGDRALLPDAAAKLMVAPGWDVLDREGMGITEVGRTAGRQRTDNPQWAEWQIAAVKKYNLAGSILHIDAGITCNVDELGPVQRATIASYAQQVSAVPVPPPVGHPILDVDMFSDEWYRIMVQDDAKYAQAVKVTTDWYIKASGGRTPAPADVRHGLIWRGSAERERWRTLRNALQNTWPGGAPN